MVVGSVKGLELAGSTVRNVDAVLVGTALKRETPPTP